jgi:hypothetical protein
VAHWYVALPAKTTDIAHCSPWPASRRSPSRPLRRLCAAGPRRSHRWRTHAQHEPDQVSLMRNLGRQRSNPASKRGSKSRKKPRLFSRAFCNHFAFATGTSMLPLLRITGRPHVHQDRSRKSGLTDRPAAVETAPSAVRGRYELFPGDQGCKAARRLRHGHHRRFP